MPERRLLYLTQHQMLAYRWQGGHCLPEGDFAPENAGTDFFAYLQKYRGSLFTLVVNIAEEGFQQETIPYVQSRDRAVIVERKLAQAFLGAPLTVAVPLGHEKTARRNERLLLAALTSASILQPWALALRAAESRLTAIHSLPLLTDTLTAQLRLPKERSIFVSVQDGTVRQSFIDKGHLVFSRVAPLSNSSIGGMTQSIVSEISRLQQYLQSQRLVGRGDTVTAHVLLHPAALAALVPEAAPPNVRLHAIDLHEAARKLGCKDLPEDSRAQTLFLQIASTAPPAQQFATPAMRKEYRLWRAGNALRAAGLVTFMSCALYAGKIHFDQQRVVQRAAQLDFAATDMERRYRAVIATFPPMPMDNDALRQVVDRLQAIQQGDHLPGPLLRHLAQALDRVPQVELVRLEWHGGPPAGSTPTAGASASAAEEALSVRGTIYAGRGGSPRQLIDLFERFVNQLRSDAGLAVAVIKQPFDVASGKSLKSGESGAATEVPRDFELRIQRASQP